MRRKRVTASAAIVAACAMSSFASTATLFAWGDEGHEVVGLIAKHFLDAPVRAKVDAILGADGTHLTAKDIASEATWADKYRDSDRNTTKVRYTKTHEWHFVDLELQGPDVASACFGKPALPPGSAATNGPARDCVVDKIDQFSAELGDPATHAAERRRALQFLLHFVGDVHQPLHSSDDHDEGGNLKSASGSGIQAGNLHHDWDTEFVKRLGPDPAAIAQVLIGKISDADRAQWSGGTSADWAMETFAVGKQHAYGMLPAPTRRNHYKLTPAYVDDATREVGEQLSKAGVRLAMLLNQALK
jgi:hypothetical protein